MRYDLSVYWVEDSTGWCDSIRELMELELCDDGIAVDFVTESNVGTAQNEMENSCKGFKKYDLFFVDFNISSAITGKDIIDSLRKYNVDVDILFYSANREKEIRKTIAENLSSYEGVYIANRDTFQEKALGLIQKNARKMLSIQNIRGKLMDCTSENDFIINSYILESYPKLSAEQKAKVDATVSNYVEVNILPQSNAIKEFSDGLKANGIVRIKDFMKKDSSQVPLKLKYKLFELIASELGESQIRFEHYFESVVKKRNVLAHKKLDLCDKQDHIKYCDTMQQYKARACENQCTGCNNSYSISVDDWTEIRKHANLYSQVFDGMLVKLSGSD